MFSRVVSLKIYITVKQSKSRHVFGSKFALDIREHSIHDKTEFFINGRSFLHITKRKINTLYHYVSANIFCLGTLESNLMLLIS